MKLALIMILSFCSLSSSLAASRNIEGQISDLVTAKSAGLLEALSGALGKIPELASAGAKVDSLLHGEDKAKLQKYIEEKYKEDKSQAKEVELEAINYLADIKQLSQDEVNWLHLAGIGDPSWDDIRNAYFRQKKKAPGNHWIELLILGLYIPDTDPDVKHDKMYDSLLLMFHLGFNGTKDRGKVLFLNALSRRIPLYQTSPKRSRSLKKIVQKLGELHALVVREKKVEEYKIFAELTAFLMYANFMLEDYEATLRYSQYQVSYLSSCLKTVSHLSLGDFAKAKEAYLEWKEMSCTEEEANLREVIGRPLLKLPK